MWNKIKSLFSTKASRTFKNRILFGSDGAVWTKRDYANFAKEAYMVNSIAFRCILEIAESVASVAWKQFKRVGKDESEITEDQPEILERANPEESFSFFMKKLTAFLALCGNSYAERIILEGGPNKGTLKELYALRPDRMQVLIHQSGMIAGQFKGYRHTLNGQHTDFEIDESTGQCDVLHFRTFHPQDDFYGLANTEPGAREIDTSNEATSYNKNLLQNQGRPGMIISIILDPDRGFTELSDKQFELLEKQLNDEEKFSGLNVGKSLILQGAKGTKAEPYGFSPRDLDYIEGGRELARRICSVYRVPPQLIGIPGETKYKNYQEARLSFWEDTIFSYLEYFKGEFNNWMYPIGSEFFIKPILDNVPALAPRRQIYWDRAQNSDFLTVNEKREMTGKQPIDGGDVILIPLTVVPLGSETPSEDEMKKSLQSQGFSEEQINDMLGG